MIKRIGKFMLVLVVLGVLVFGVGTALKSCDKSTPEAPSVKDAPYKVTADGRHYFTAKYEEGKDYFGKYILMHGYYYVNDSLEWVKRKGDLKLSERGFKVLSVTRRS